MSKRIKLIILISAMVVVLAAMIASIIIIFGDESKPANASDEVSSVDSEMSSSESSDASSSGESNSETTSSEPERIKLEVTAPGKDITVYVNKTIIKGSADPSQPLYINDELVEVDQNGLFLKEVTLSVGSNWFTVKQGEDIYECVVRYKKIVILEVNPTDKLTLDGGSTLTVSVRALAKSTVTATFNGNTITLSEKPVEKQEEYSDYYGRFEMPVNYEKDVTYGNIKFKAVSSEGSGTANGSKITVKRSEYPEEEDYYMPTGGQYIDVGHTFIAEVVCRSAETMSVDDLADYSRPTNNYLPKGTVDYCSVAINQMGNLEMRTLRYGKQLYMRTNSTGENIKVYKGELPDINKVNIAEFSSEGRHSTLTLDVDWKAPFHFDLGPQKYTDTKTSEKDTHLDYTISSATYAYVDITFCYAGEFTGEIDLTDNNIFSSYEIIKNESDYTLRLHLKKKGKFYGWSAEYNSVGQLVFSFLNPAKLVAAENKYGYSLEGVTILIDAGHGGKDPGASGFQKGIYEKTLTLLLAKKLEERLKALGADVVMTRSDDVTVEPLERMNKVRDTKPDYVLSIHRNSSSSSKPSAFNSYHFTAFSSDAAKYIYNETEKEALYNVTKWSGVQWHYFFLARCTECPSVLTENGYMSNKEEFNKIADISDPEFNDKCADAFVDGIFAYFKSIQ